MTGFTRRHSLVLFTAAALAGCAADGPSPATSDIFRHGVASGDPGPDSVVLWTRATTKEEVLEVTWQVAEDASFRSIVASGRSAALRSADHTVKIIPEGLTSGQIYFYRFRSGSETSPIGRTRTLNTGPLEHLGVALVSCSNFGFGHFNAYDAIARDPEIDFVLHTGDYIYEYGNPELQMSHLRVRSMEPALETLTLEDYRLRHAQSKSDPSSQAMHAAHPLLACWDDHEVANDPWTGGAQNHQPATEGLWTDRRDAALKAYYEWMPVRNPAAGRNQTEFWRTYRFGNLATLVTLETRHSARGQQVSYSAYKDKLKSNDDRDRFLRDVLDDPGREMISAGLKGDLHESLKSSVVKEEPWRLIGNPSLLVRVKTPDLAQAGLRPEEQPELALFDKYTDIFWKSEWALPATTDSWDGYPAARREFYQICAQAGARDLVVLTGDSHSFWANQLRDDAGRAMGVELGTAGVTSPSDFMLAGLPPSLATRLDALTAAENPEVVWKDSLHRGYVKVAFSRATAKADFIAVDTVSSTAYRTTILRTEQIVRQEDTVRFLQA